MGIRRPLARILGRTRQLPAGDIVNGVYPPYIPMYTAAGVMRITYRRDGEVQGVAPHIIAVQASGAELQVATDANFAVTVTQVAGTTCLVNAGVLGITQKVVYQFANLAAFPAIGSPERIYFALDTKLEYVWSGNGYITSTAAAGTVLSTTDDLPEGTTNLYFTAARALAAITSSDVVTEGVTNLYFTAARVRAVVLTGLSTATATAITAADTVLSALGKLQAQIDNKLDVNGDGSGLTSLNASQLTSGTVPSGRLSGTYGISVTGNSGSATVLQTARTINGVSFDGSANITLPASGIFTNSFVSANQTLGVATMTTIAHGLGALPKVLFVRLVRVTTSLGWTAGQEVNIDPISYDRDQNSGSNYTRGIQVHADSTNVYVTYSTSGDIDTLIISGGSTGGRTVAVTTDWRLKVYAYA